jgi:hypothetical protein
LFSHDGVEVPAANRLQGFDVAHPVAEQTHFAR